MFIHSGIYIIYQHRKSVRLLLPPQLLCLAEYFWVALQCEVSQMFLLLFT